MEAHRIVVLVGTCSILDFVPKGRDEDNLPWTMACAGAGI